MASAPRRHRGTPAPKRVYLTGMPVEVRPKLPGLVWEPGETGRTFRVGNLTAHEPQVWLVNGHFAVLRWICALEILDSLNGGDSQRSPGQKFRKRYW